MKTWDEKPVDEHVDEPEWLLSWLWQADPIKGWPLEQRCERITTRVMAVIQDLEMLPKGDLTED